MVVNKDVEEVVVVAVEEEEEEGEEEVVEKEGNDDEATIASTGSDTALCDDIGSSRSSSRNLPETFFNTVIELIVGNTISFFNKFSFFVL